MAATFTVQDITKESATIVVSGIVAGTTIRFYLCSVEDPDNFFFDDEHIATSAAINKTYTGLSPGTEYAVNVKPDPNGEWLGKQTFFTEALPVVDANGKLIRAPLLDANYPSFDWDYWPNSFAALVSGGLTSEFEKECWNDIVDTLYDALTEAGLEWDDKYAAYSDSRITEVYGDLYADVFNSIRHNIEKPAPFGFRWAYDPNFRGYIGRADFKGVDAVGEKAADDVYPEYFKELVRRLNLLIDILRCNGFARPFWGNGESFSDHYNKAIRQAPSRRFRIESGSMSDYYNEAIRRGRSGVMRVDPFGIITDYTRGVYVGYGGRMVVDPFGTTTRYVNLMRRGVPVYLETDEKLVSTEYKSDFRAGESALVEYCNSIINQTLALLRAGPSAIVSYDTPIVTREIVPAKLGTGAQVHRYIEVESVVFPGIRAGEAAQLRTDRPLAHTAYVRNILNGIGRRFKPQVVSRTVVPEHPIRGGIGNNLATGPQIVMTPSLNLMRGGIPIYLETNKSLLNTTALVLYRDGTSALVTVREISENLPYAAIRQAPSVRVWTNKSLVSAAGVMFSRTGDPVVLEGRGFSLTDRSRGWYRQDPGALVKGRGQTNTDIVWALFRAATLGRFIGLGISSTDKSRGFLRKDPSDVWVGVGHTGTKRSRLFGRNGEASRFTPQDVSSTDQSGMVLRQSPPAAMLMHSESVTETTGLVILGTPFLPQDVSRTETTGLIILGTPIAPQSVSRTETTSAVVLGTPVEGAQDESTTITQTQVIPAVGAIGKLIGRSQSTYTRITFSARQEFAVEIVPGEVSTLYKSINMSFATTLEASILPQRADSAFKLLQAVAAISSLVRLAESSVTSASSRPDVIAGIRVPLEYVPTSFAVKATKPELLTGIPMYGSGVPEVLQSNVAASTDTSQAAPTGGSDVLGTNATAEVCIVEAINLAGLGAARPKERLKVEAVQIAPVVGRPKNSTTCTMHLGTAWYPPAWVDGGLWIRQSHNVTQNENGELVIT